MTWVAVADAGAIESEDVIEVSVGEHVLAIYGTSAGYFATDGFCTHERARQAEALVIGNVIECPKHRDASMSVTAHRRARPPAFRCAPSCQDR